MLTTETFTSTVLQAKKSEGEIWKEGVGRKEGGEERKEGEEGGRGGRGGGRGGRERMREIGEREGGREGGREEGKKEEGREGSSSEKGAYSKARSIHSRVNLVLMCTIGTH